MGPVGPPGPDFPEAPADGTVYGRGGTTPAWVAALPLTGGTVSGPLNYTATGGTTSRSAQDRAAEVINVKDFGAKSDGVADDTAALNAAAAAIPATGGTLYVPKGRYSVSGSLLIKSLTRVVGDGWGSVIAANAAWVNNSTFQLILNQNYMAATITDHDIVVENLAFDYTTMPSGLSGSANGGMHSVSCRMARNVQVRNCRFEGGTLGNAATAMVACDTTLVESCVAYNMQNCAYDHWWNPQNAKVLNCYYRGPCVGMLFNPDPTSGSSSGFAANNFQAIGNTFINTNATILGCQLEPLNPGCTVSNVAVISNTFSNSQVVCRGAVTGATITGNTFVAMSNGNAIYLLPANGGTPSGVVVTDNVIINPSTTGPAPITVLVDGAIITGNQITGTAYGATAGIDTGTNAAVVIGNSVSNGTINATAAVAGTGDVTLRNGANLAWKDASGSRITWDIGVDNHMIWYGTGSAGAPRLIMDMYQRSDSSAMSWSVPTTFASTLAVTGATTLTARATASNGISFGAQVALGGPTDLSKHIELYAGAGYGWSVTASSLNHVTGAAGSHVFYQGTTNVGAITPSGLSMPVGQGTPLAGTFSFVQVTTGGPTWTTGSAAPASTQPVGSIYSRVGGAVGATLYVSRGAGTWAAVAGV